MLRQKGNLKQVNTHRDRSIRVLRPDLQFDRYLVALCSLMLMVVLAVAATGSAGIQGLLSSSTVAAKDARVEPLSRAAHPDPIVTPAAIALALVAVVFVVVADRT
jgi:hypothetical protein